MATMRTFEEIWRQDISDGIGNISPEQEAQLKAFCQAGFDACAKVKDMEIAAWETRFPNYQYRQQDDCVALK